MGGLYFIIDDIFCKVWRREVSETSIRLVHGCHLIHFILGEREVENVEVLLHPFDVTALWNGYDIALREPAKRYLCGRLTILLPDIRKQIALNNAINSLATKRSPSHRFGIGFGQNGLYVVLLCQHIALQLVDHWFHIHEMCKVIEACSLEV